MVNEDAEELFSELYDTLPRNHYPLKLKELFYKDFIHYMDFLESFKLNLKQGNVLGVGLTNVFELVAIRRVFNPSKLDVIDKVYGGRALVRLVDRFVQADITDLKLKEAYDLVVLRHFPVNHKNSRQLIAAITGCLRKNGSIIASFYYFHEFKEFLGSAGAVLSYGRSKNPLFFDEKQREMLRASPIQMNLIRDEQDYEVSQRDKWFVYMRKK